jgi:hypothetical protein
MGLPVLTIPPVGPVGVQAAHQLGASVCVGHRSLKEPTYYLLDSTRI